MHLLFDLSTLWLVIVLCALPGVTGFLVYWVAQRSPAADWVRSFAGVVAPFFTAVGILFALFAAFLGTDIWQRVQVTNHSLEREVSALQSMMQIADSLGPEGEPIRRDVRRYVHETLDEELSSRGHVRSAVADLALERLVHAILDLPENGRKSNVVQQALMSDYNKVWDARATRRHIADTHSDPYKWFAVIFLGVLTQVALALGHADKPRPMAASLLIFSLGFLAVLVALVMHERPLADPELVSLDHVYRILGEEFR